MYTGYFGLKQEPFSIAPDPRLLFMSERHREALAHLLYGVRGGGGFVLLTGEIGTGKTTVFRSFMDQVPGNCNLAYIFNPKLTVPELLETVCHEFRIEVPRKAGALTVKDYLDPLNAFLLDAHAAGRNNVLVIDEAQNLSADVLEQLRLLTNLETSERKLLQIILIGQPELRDMLARPELEQLAQRVVARYHLQALTESETAQYVRHRMEVCGLQRPLPFDSRALKRIHQASGGVPRRINLLCDRALLGAFATGQGTVTANVVDQAAREVFDSPRKAASPWHRPAIALGIGLAAGAGLLAAATQGGRSGPPAATVASVAPLGGAPTQANAAVTSAATLASAAITSASTHASAAVRTAPTQSAPQAPRVAGAAVPADDKGQGTIALLNDEDSAWRELAQAWKLTPGAGPVCDAFTRENAQCFSRKLNIALIRQLDRPGFVKLDANTTHPSYAILTGLGATTATLRAGGVEHTVALTALASRWQGDYYTLWRSPEGYKLGLTAGPAMDWLNAKLKDQKTDMRSFQIAQGLPADGKPGPFTFMQINRLAGIDEPRLRKVP